MTEVCVCVCDHSHRKGWLSPCISNHLYVCGILSVCTFLWCCVCVCAMCGNESAVSLTYSCSTFCLAISILFIFAWMAWWWLSEEVVCVCVVPLQPIMTAIFSACLSISTPIKVEVAVKWTDRFKSQCCRFLLLPSLFWVPCCTPYTHTHTHTFVQLYLWGHSLT